MNINELLNQHFGIVETNFKNLSKLNFCGVYIICDKDNEVVYVGSAYARSIQARLKQYLSPKDTGNTLGKAIAKSLAQSKKYDENAKLKMKDAIIKIKTYKIFAIKHNDLEYKLIDASKPKYNNIGIGED